MTIFVDYYKGKEKQLAINNFFNKNEMPLILHLKLYKKRMYIIIFYLVIFFLILDNFDTWLVF